MVLAHYGLSDILARPQDHLEVVGYRLHGVDGQVACRYQSMTKTLRLVWLASNELKGLDHRLCMHVASNA